MEAAGRFQLHVVQCNVGTKKLQLQLEVKPCSSAMMGTSAALDDWRSSVVEQVIQNVHTPVLDNECRLPTILLCFEDSRHLSCLPPEPDP